MTSDNRNCQFLIQDTTLRFTAPLVAAMDPYASYFSGRGEMHHHAHGYGHPEMHHHAYGYGHPGYGHPGPYPHHAPPRPELESMSKEFNIMTTIPGATVGSHPTVNTLHPWGYRWPTSTVTNLPIVPAKEKPLTATQKRELAELNLVRCGYASRWMWSGMWGWASSLACALV